MTLAIETGLSENDVKRIQDIFTKYPEIEKALLYGSRALGNYRNGSDIDLTLVGEKLTLKKLLQLEVDLDELWLPYSFDISLFHQIKNSALVEHIEKLGVLFYQKM